MEEEKGKQSAEQRFLADVRREIKWQAAWPSIHAELSDHLTELKADLLEAGATPEEAQAQAVAAMGDGAEIGRELNGLHRPQLAKGLLALSGVLAVLGIATLFYAYTLGYRMQLRGTLCGLIVGLAVAAALYFSDYSKWLKWSPAIYGAGVALAIVQHVRMDLFSRGIRDGSMLAVFILTVAVAGCLELWRNRGSFGLCSCGLLATLSVLLILVNNPALILPMGIWYTVLFSLAIHWGYFGKNTQWSYTILYGVVLTTLALIALWIVVKPHRLFCFTNRSWQQGQALQTFQHAQWWGAADLSGVPAMGVAGPAIVAEPLSGFAFTRIIGDCGLLAGVIILVVFALLLGLGWRKMSRIKNHYGQMIGLSAVAYLTFQTVGNILMNVGLMWEVNTFLPFFTIGGSNMLVSWALVGMVLAIWRRNTILTDSHLLGKEENDLADSHSLGSKGNGEQDRQIITYDDGILTIDCRRWLDSKKTSE